MEKDKTSLRWYRIIVEEEEDNGSLPFARFYREHFGGRSWPGNRRN